MKNRDWKLETGKICLVALCDSFVIQLRVKVICLNPTFILWTGSEVTMILYMEMALP